MWILKEIETEMKLGRCDEKLSELQIHKKCIENNVEPKLKFGSDGKILGYGITDDECKYLFRLS
jgi:hypothetical protein